MRRTKHLTPRYIASRLFEIFYRYRNPNAPWLTPDAVKIMDELLLPSDFGLEFGAGRSTTWLSRRVRHLVSIETDEKWFDRVSKHLESIQKSNVDLMLVGDGFNLPATEQYLAPLAKIKNASLDFALIDGRHRDHASLAVIDLLKPGGILILDNVNRYLPHKTFSPYSVGPAQQPPTETWCDFYARIKRWRLIHTSNGVTDTALFFKP